MGSHKPAYGPSDQLWDRPGRLIGILWQLAAAGDAGLTVKELQRVYRVSDRQIARDLETLERARIPLVTHAGGSNRRSGGRRWFLLQPRDRVIAHRLAELTGTAPLVPHQNLRRLSA